MTAVSSFGTLLKVGNGVTPTEVFTTIGSVKDISGPKLSLATEEITHQGSAAAEFIGTVADYGEVSFDVNFDYGDGTHAGLIDDLQAGTLRHFQLDLTDSNSTTISFSGIVTGFELKAAVKGVLSASISLKVSGEATFA